MCNTMCNTATRCATQLHLGAKSVMITGSRWQEVAGHHLDESAQQNSGCQASFEHKLAYMLDD